MVENMIQAIIEELVDRPEHCRVKKIIGDTLTVLEVTVAEDDIGKVIGRSGKNADAIRTLVNCVGAKEKKKYLVQMQG